MSTIYTFEDIKASCSSIGRIIKVGAQVVPVCNHQENRQQGKAYGPCGESVCPIIRAILDEGEEWE